MAKFRVEQTESTFFKLSVEKFDSIFEVFEKDVEAQIERMRATGIADDEIFSRISNSLDNGLDLFGTAKGAIEQEIDGLLGTTAQAESNGVFEALEEPLKWELDPTVKEHCVDCLRNSGEGSKTFDEWREIGLPGFGNTECGEYCKCSLEKA